MEGGSGPSIFAWHNIWTAPSLPLRNFNLHTSGDQWLRHAAAQSQEIVYQSIVKESEPNYLEDIEIGKPFTPMNYELTLGVDNRLELVEEFNWPKEWSKD